MSALIKTSSKGKLGRAAIESLENRAYFNAVFAPQPGITLPTPASGFLYQRPVVGDFDGDTKVDLIVAQLNTAVTGATGSFSFLKGNGVGGFASPANSKAVVSNYEPAAGDFDDDGDLDLVFTEFGVNELHVFLNNGNGTFADPVDFSTPGGPFQIRAADFNKDGIDDLAWVNGSAGSVTIRLGSASTTLGSPLTLDAGTGPTGIAIGDFNNDDNLDIVVGNRDSNDLSGFAGNGDGTFDAEVLTTGQNTPVDAGDFNEDGNDDLLRGVDSTFVPFLALSNGDMSFAATTGLSQAFNANVGDVDGDGNLDVVGAGLSGGSAAVAYGNGDGTFDPTVGVALITQGSSITSIGRTADVNNDGFSDLIFAIAPESTDYSLIVALAAPVDTPNLVPSAVGTLPASVVGGDAGKTSVRITNSGTGEFKATVDLRLLASTDGNADGGDTQIVTVPVKLSLKPGKSKIVKLKFDYPSGLADGAYSILAQVDPAASASQNPKTDDVASLGQVTIAAPFTDLGVSFPVALKSDYDPGKKAKITVRLANAGNVLADGTAVVTLVSSADTTVDSGDLTLGTATVKVKIKPGAAKNFRVSFTLPDTAPPGSTNLIATIAPTLGVADNNSVNDSAIAAQPFVVFGPT